MWRRLSGGHQPPLQHLRGHVGHGLSLLGCHCLKSVVRLWGHTHLSLHQRLTISQKPTPGLQSLGNDWDPFPIMTFLNQNL